MVCAPACVHCMCHTVCACAVCTNTHAMVLWKYRSPHPLCLVEKLHITQFFAQKTYLKGWWSIWVVLWVFTPQFLPLIRQTSPPNPPKEAEGSGRSWTWESGHLYLGPVPLNTRWFECHTEAVKSVSQVRVQHIPLWTWLNASFLTSCFDALWRQCESHY